MIDLTESDDTGLISNRSRKKSIAVNISNSNIDSRGCINSFDSNAKKRKFTTTKESEVLYLSDKEDEKILDISNESRKERSASSSSFSSAPNGSRFRGTSPSSSPFSSLSSSSRVNEIIQLGRYAQYSSSSSSYGNIRDDIHKGSDLDDATRLLLLQYTKEEKEAADKNRMEEESMTALFFQAERDERIKELEEKRFTCEICLNPKLSIGEIITLSCQPVGHRFCKSCFTGYCEKNIQENLVGDLVCPAVGCKELITPNELKVNVTSEGYRNYERNELKKLCEKNNWKTCPACDEWIVDIPQGDQDVVQWRSVKCGLPSCGALFCGRCLKKPHKGQYDQNLTCSRYSEWVKDRVNGGSALHVAAALDQLEVVKRLVSDGADCSQKDDLGNTPLLCAVENGHPLVVQYLSHCSPWHTVNKENQESFLNILMRLPYANINQIIQDIKSDAIKALGDDTVDPSIAWAAAKYFNHCSCVALDELMDMTGLEAVKQRALEVYHSIREDLSRPIEARVASKQAMNFLFLGNPGSGKTTVARIFGKILFELKLRTDNFVETSGQKLLQEGSSKFAALLLSATPGILFIDEVYQLDPNGNSDGRAITNALMEAAENDRDKLTIIAAGYREDVVEKWCSFNPGIMSRFPFEIMFEDFNERELRNIFLNNLHAMHWQLERYSINDSKSIDLTASTIIPTVDVAKVAATRLYKGANKRGFGNARAVRALVEKAQRAASKRQKQEQLTGQVLSSTHNRTMTLIDVIGPPIDVSRSPIVAELMGMTGLSDVKKAVMGLLQMSIENYQSELRGEAVLDISLHRMFLGNPGTGKTSIARVFGRILVELGYLTNGEVIVVGASKLVGGVVGATPKIVNDLIDSVLGKVLVIDEAYVLARANNMYGREALDTLVERVQGIPRTPNTLIP